MDSYHTSKLKVAFEQDLSIVFMKIDIFRVKHIRMYLSPGTHKLVYVFPHIL
jgi:hypothetical protein